MQISEKNDEVYIVMNENDTLKIMANNDVYNENTISIRCKNGKLIITQEKSNK